MEIIGRKGTLVEPGITNGWGGGGGGGIPTGRTDCAIEVGTGCCVIAGGTRPLRDKFGH